jgi:hypothetical protein
MYKTAPMDWQSAIAKPTAMPKTRVRSRSLVNGFSKVPARTAEID